MRSLMRRQTPAGFETKRKSKIGDLGKQSQKWQLHWNHRLRIDVAPWLRQQPLLQLQQPICRSFRVRPCKQWIKCGLGRMFA